MCDISKSKTFLDFLEWFSQSFYLQNPAMIVMN